MGWGIGSMGASPSFSGWANIFAAMFAAMSLGFLAPADDFCKNARIFVSGACALRAGGFSSCLSSWQLPTPLTPR
jgi:hypothetical protein